MDIRRAEGSFGLTLISSFSGSALSMMFMIYWIADPRIYEHNLTACWFWSAIGFIVGGFVGTLVHELAHFFVALWLGSDVYLLTIGSGKLLITFPFFGASFDLHESLHGGAVLHSIKTPVRARLRMAGITAAGPISSIILAGGCLLLLHFLFLSQAINDAYFVYLLPFMMGVTVYCILLIFLVLIPFSYYSSSLKVIVLNDALRLMTIPWMSDSSIKEIIEAGQAKLKNRTRINPFTKSLKEAIERAQLSPNDEIALATAAEFMDRTWDKRSFVYFEELVSKFPNSPHRAWYIDGYLTRALELDLVSKNAEEMDQLSQELLSTNPDNISTLGTRGSILVDLGRTEEGKTMLLHVMDKTESEVDKFYSGVFLALAEQKLGNLIDAQRHVEAVKRNERKNPSFSRLVKAGLATAE